MTTRVDSLYGPQTSIGKEIHAEKYRQTGESFVESMDRLSSTLSDNKDHQTALFNILSEQRFLPAGRVQSAVGARREVTPLNCYVSSTIHDDSNSILDAVKEAFLTLRLGGGIGYDFSLLRPAGDVIKSLDSTSSGPLSFMKIFDAVCGTVSSAGHRRGAQMGILRVDHPSIEDFIVAKQNKTNLTNFNISIAITDEFMTAVTEGRNFALRFNDKIYKYVDARALWDSIMWSTWDWAEPGVIFIDRVNQYNNLWYSETISATNPCGEQPLPPNGACLLGSFNLVKYLKQVGTQRQFDFVKLENDVYDVVRAMDNVVDVAMYPLEKQKKTHKSNRRMGLGITGTANALEAMRHSYGSENYIRVQTAIMKTLRDAAYDASMELALEKGTFPVYDSVHYPNGKFIQTLPVWLRTKMSKTGIRNSHLLSVAPTGTISLAADNISSGIEPVFSHEYNRTINMPDGVRVEKVEDYGVRVFGVHGKTADECSVDDHVNVLINASQYVDSAVSKTCNVGESVSFEQFKDIYLRAWEGGAKGCTTFRAAGKRMGILTKTETEEVQEGAACTFDPQTGMRSCAG